MNDNVEDLTELRLWSLEKIGENKTKVAHAYNKKVKLKEFQVRDLVWEVEGLEKVTRGGEWKTIKIPRRNLAYISKLTRHVSISTQPRPHSYSKAIGLWNRVRDHSRNTKQC
jgi:hypothetical protein